MIKGLGRAQAELAKVLVHLWRNCIYKLYMVRSLADGVLLAPQT